MNPVENLEFFEHYGIFILPALTVAEQIGIPLPAVPALLAMGALAAHGRVNVLIVLAAISLAALLTDLAWYEVGRRLGNDVLVRLYRWSSKPEDCRRRAEAAFARHGARSILVAKFVPGLTTVMPPLAGVFGVTRLRFALYDLAGVLLWAGTWLSAGYFFSDGIALIGARASSLGQALGLVIVVALIGYVLFRYGRRQRWRGHVVAGIPAKGATGDATSDNGRNRRLLDAA